MRKMSSRLALGALAACMAAGYSVNAADHREAPTASAMLAADIGDYYAWHASDQLNLIMTFGTFANPGEAAAYDSTVLYGFHFDTSETADGIADVSIFARFAQDSAGNWGVQITQPDGSLLEGAVETVLSNDQGSAWAGLADDPFFFDQEGFQNTLATGTLAFDPTRDSVAGLNITAIAIQLPLDDIASVGSFQTWSTTAAL